jgi:hypothetical protein
MDKFKLSHYLLLGLESLNVYMSKYIAFALIPQGANSTKVMAAMLVFLTKESN